MNFSSYTTQELAILKNQGLEGTWLLFQAEQSVLEIDKAAYPRGDILYKSSMTTGHLHFESMSGKDYNDV